MLGYSISLTHGGFVRNRDKVTLGGPPERDSKNRVRVQISRAAYRNLHAWFVENARRRRVDWFADQFWNIGYEPYAPIRKQLLGLLRQVNKARGAVGLEKLSADVLRYQHRPVKPFAQQLSYIDCNA